MMVTIQGLPLDCMGGGNGWRHLSNNVCEFRSITVALQVLGGTSSSSFRDTTGVCIKVSKVGTLIAGWFVSIREYVTPVEKSASSH